MNTRLLGLAAVLALSISDAAMAQAASSAAGEQTATSSVAASAVGRWLHDSQGRTIGSVRRLADDGRTAVIMVGSYFTPGSHEATVPARAISIVNGKVTLQANTVEALNTSSRR